MESEEQTSLTLSIWDLNDQEQVDATTHSREAITCHDIQFMSEVKRLMNRKDFARKDDFSCRLFRVRVIQEDRQRELVFLQTVDLDRLDIKDQLRSVLTGTARQTKNKLVNWISAFLSRQQYALYIVALVGSVKKTAKVLALFTT